MSENRLRKARREAWRSFLHKLGIVAVAMLAYAGLVSLGHAKHRHAKDEKAKWQLTRATLTTLADKADTVAPTVEQSPQNASGRVLSDTQLLRDIANHFHGGGKGVKGTIDTKPELVAAVEQIVDTRIWRDTTVRISQLAPDVVAATADKGAGAVNTQPARDIEHYLDRVAGEESLARTRMAGTHALIEASATQIEADTKDSPPPLQSMFDEKHPLYVLYEICWYMLLALAVLASSWLVVTIFTVLPFTDAEGYWTKRIGDLLEKFAPGMASAALPLASAALIAATVFTGTSFATTPGGYSRRVTTVTTVDDRSTHGRFEQAPPSTALTPQDLENALAGLQTAIAGQIGESEGHLRKTVETKANTLNRHLDHADDRQRKTLTTAASADQHSGNAELEAQESAVQATKAADRTERVATIDQTTKELSRAIGTVPPPEKPLVQHVGTIASDLADSSKGIGAAKAQIDAEYAEGSQARNAALAQAATVDPRGFLGRSFGRTLFKVSPAAVHQMAAYLGVTLNAEGRPVPYKPKGDPATDPQPKKTYTENADLITLLIEATSLEPKYSGEFRAALEGKPLNPDGKTLTLDGKPLTKEIKKRVKRYDRELLHLCALPRD